MAFRWWRRLDADGVSVVEAGEGNVNRAANGVELDFLYDTGV